MKETLQTYRNLIDASIAEFIERETKARENLKAGNINSLFEPVRYFMSNGGKRIRPLLLLISNELFGGEAGNALDAAIALELLHNFTLVHDDIMDNANTRRGRDTIHRKWDVNTAILVGDELIGLSYRSLLRTKTRQLVEVIKAFTDGVIEVCEGQAMDKEFELSEEVTVSDYRVMIRKKTAELLKASAVIGALIGNADESGLSAVRSFAENIGLAFQIQDDLLDVTANETSFGKKIGGDIIEKKKTYLYLKAIEVMNSEDAEKFKKLFNSKDTGPSKIDRVIEVYKANCVLESAKKEIETYTVKANEAIGQLDKNRKAEILAEFSDMILKRKY